MRPFIVGPGSAECSVITTVLLPEGLRSIFWTLRRQSLLGGVALDALALAFAAARCGPQRSRSTLPLISRSSSVKGARSYTRLSSVAEGRGLLSAYRIYTSARTYCANELSNTREQAENACGIMPPWLPNTRVACLSPRPGTLQLRRTARPRCISPGRVRIRAFRARCTEQAL